MIEKKEKPEVDLSEKSDEVLGNVQQEAELENVPSESKETPGAESTVEDSSNPDVKEATVDHEKHEEDHELKEIPDFSDHDKAFLTNYLIELKDEQDMRLIDRVLRQIKPRFDELFNEVKSEALKKFLLNEDASEEDFEFKGDEVDQKFLDYFNLLRERKNVHFRNLESQKEANLKQKNQILDQIRELVDGEESNISISAIKKLQDEWKKTGPVPAAQNKLLWANYNALLDRFYDARSIYFELKELDRKKNLEAKIEIVQKAEKLLEIEDVKLAIFQLNELHDEFKHLGPVPKEQQEEIWKRLKTASDLIYAKRKIFTDEIKIELNKNLEKKQEIADAVLAFTLFDSDRISEWNAKTKEILDLQKKWDEIGGLPREKAKAVNKLFWNGFKKFFNHKNQFFKKLEANREESIAQKEELIKKAIELSESKEWEKTSNELKKLQQDWKETGPVPEKDRNALYDRFKKACDHFFERRRQLNKEQNKELDENFAIKKHICEELELIVKSDSIAIDTILDKIDQYMAAGYVPRQHVKKLHDRFDKIIMALVNHPDMSSEDRNELKISIEVSRMRGGPNAGQKINRKEHSLKRRISTLENDINTYKTNIDFLASSKNADKLKVDLQKRIDEGISELENLQAQLKMIKQL